jgi:site-specific recombinase XerD
MPRGRPRKHSPTIPAHIDQSRLPVGIYWDPSGAGRWYVRTPDPKRGHLVARVVAGAAARLSDLHAIVEARKGGSAKGTIAHVLDAFHVSGAFKRLAASTRKHYADYARAIKTYPTRAGKLGDLLVDRLEPPVFRTLVDRIACGDADTPGYPTKANHWLRYLKRAFGWGVQHGACTTNPCRAVECVPEVRNARMPARLVFRKVQMYARACSMLGAREPGSLPPYLWAAMEIAYTARLRGIEVLTLTDAHDWDDDLLTNRRKGSRDNLVRKNSGLAHALDALRVYRAQVWARRKRGIPLRPEQRSVFVGEDGEPLTRAGFNTAWGRMMRAAIRDGVIAAEQRFGLHGLKHRGVTDTKGTTAEKQDAAGHKTPAMTHLYDHELRRVEPAGEP